jgi:hypothetical protein
MIEAYFFRTPTLNRLRGGPLGSDLDDLATVIPGKPPSPVITVSSVLAFRKHRCENTPLT